MEIDNYNETINRNYNRQFISIQLNFIIELNFKAIKIYLLH